MRGILAAAAGAVLLAGCATLPAPPALPASALAAPRASANGETYLRAWEIVRSKYYDAKVDGPDWTAARDRYFAQAVAGRDDLQLYAAINALIGELHDPHTAAETPRQNTERRTGRAARMGLSLLLIDGRWAVTEVAPGSPAEGAGIRPGWILLAEDGKPVGLSVPSHIDGQIVHDDFLDEGDRPVEVALRATSLQRIPPPEERLLDGGIVYLQFNEFVPGTRRWLSTRLKAHRHAPAVIIDLRRNLGGDFISTDIAIGEFFDHSVSAGTFLRRSWFKMGDPSLEIFSAHYPGKVAILVGSGSASAAEIFARVLQYQRRATVIGSKTPGAVRGSAYFGLSDGGCVQVSIVDYRGPDGIPLEGNGVVPDVPASGPTLADIRAGRDPCLQAALLRLNAAVVARKG